MRFVALVVLLVVIALGLTFSVMNAEPVNLNYYFGSAAIPLALLLVGAVVLGAILGVLASLSAIFRVKRDNSRLRREARLAEKEVTNLRSIPLRDRH